MKISYVKTREAVGKVIFHDVTGIVKGKFKGAAFKKGHVIREEDIPVLLDLGKEHVYSLQIEKGDVHEDEAGRRIAEAAAGKGVVCRKASEGRVNLYAAYDGLLRINVEGLQSLNMQPEIVLASLHTHTPVNYGAKVAGTRVIPLVVSEETVRCGEDICYDTSSLIKVDPYLPVQVKVLVTGKEVYQGRVKDAFGPVLKEKTLQFNLAPPEVYYIPDDASEISAKLKDLLDKSRQEKTIIIVTGGMSVDPDDVTPAGIKLSGARIESYGAPVLPGAMFMVAYHGEVPVLGMPACGMFYRTTVLDLVLPRLLTGEKLSALDISALGHGGLCAGCDECSYPACPFGKGGLPFGG